MAGSPVRIDVGAGAIQERLVSSCADHVWSCPMSYLATVDWWVIGIYLVAIILLGVWFGKDQKNTRDYFLGSRNIPWWGVGLSIVATETSALTFIGVPAIAYGSDISFIQIIVGYVIARVILAIVMVPFYFKGEIYSPYQLFSQSFGPSARHVAAGFFLIAGTLAAGVRVYVTCIPLQLMLGIDVFSSIVLFVVLSLVYTYVGGVKAVIWTDAVQFLLFIAGGVFTLFYVPTLIEGGWSTAMQMASEQGKLLWFRSDFSLKMPFNIWMIIGATALVMSSHGADQLIVQRVLTCGTIREGRKALALSAVIILPLFLVFLLTGVVLWAYYQNHTFAIPLPETKSGIGQYDFVFPIFILSVMPPVFKGLLIVAILSAAMSSISSALSALGSVLTMDFGKDFFLKGKSEEYLLKFSKASIVFWAAVLIVVAYLSRQSTSVLNVAFSLSGLTNGAMLGGLILVMWWQRGSAKPLVIGMLTSLACMTWLLVRHKEDVAWPWFTLIGCIITLVVAMAVRIFTGRKAQQ
ncbi:MAG: sodium:solute symporter family transporter [Verrucomicrobiales bacterium]